ncbi:MAG: formate-tetrahydrofolate ligase [archaeon GW2011_AR10]|nr:MAG: formate-tetrahydrofolate ligase [archaeon GW2011_AR10]
MQSFKYRKAEIITMKSSLEIAQKAKLKPISNIAKKLSLKEKDLEQYGNFIAKVDVGLLKKMKNKRDGKLVLITAMTPTSRGEGKTTITVGLAQALQRLGKKSMICLREPSLGPLFGIKGGAAGGGYSQVLPMEDINLHFTGDIPAVTAADNLLAALIDNYISRENKLEINPASITWRRVLDVNDRSLREVEICHSGDVCITRDDFFMISAASEIMAVLCLSESLMELKKNLGEIVIGFTRKGKPVKVRQLGFQGAMAVLLRKAINPNLVQSVEGTPAFVHGGPFANIAHGCNSIIATKLALKLSDFVVTEAGFGADLGAEKFFDIKCRKGKLKPNAVVIVATIRALKEHGNGSIKKGIPNLAKHAANIKKFGVVPVVALNQFKGDSEKEIETVVKECRRLGVKAFRTDVFAAGGKGAIVLAKEVVGVCKKKSRFKPLYSLKLPIMKKIEKIAKEIYGASSVNYSLTAEKDIVQLQKNGFGLLPVCMSKTPLSLSDNPKLKGVPENFKVHIKSARVSSGAGFIVVLTGEVMTMPGLPEKPAALNIDIDANGKIKGLF